ncbi:MAG: hypothetical protein A2520_10610 [Deltaproteobacteria bacterium RIFOXYD12_FULL_53_23]|nr:MAG: hypothetical protein A2520_10610 [Deltaproteobacteria bacterium RIFOXYD12_FULL_53_23]
MKTYKSSKRCSYRLSLLSAVILTGVSLSAAHAAPTPDAGTIMDSTKAPALSKPATSPVIDVKEAPRSGLVLSKEAKVKVAKITVTGMTVVTQEELAKILAGYEDKTLTFVELNQLTGDISKYYRDRGYLLARAYLPKQEIKDGKLEVAVLEGKIDKVEVNLDEAKRLRKAQVEALIADLKKEAVAKDSKLERSLLLLNDLPGINVTSTLTPGTSVGAADLLLNVKESRLFSGSVDLDNFGNRYTGVYRAGASLNVNDLSGYGDQLSLRAQTAGSGLLLGRIGYNLPVGSYGTKLGLAYSSLTYELGKDLEILGYEGDSSVLSFYAAHPFVRSRRTNLYGIFGYDYKRMEDEGLGHTINDRQVDVVTFGLNGDWRDGIGGGAVNAAGLSLFKGDLDIQDAVAKATDAQTRRTDGSFSKIRYNLSRMQYLTPSLSAFASLQGQFASGNLDSSEKFSLGGPYGVRAYPQGEAAADEALLVNLELRWDLPLDNKYGVPQLVFFYDFGRVLSLYEETWYGWQGSNTALLNSYSIDGAGIGFNLTKTDDYVLRAIYARKIRDNAGRDANGNDSDNRDDDNRFWLQMVKQF